MRCKTCDYQLWNLRGRRCPECGTTFRPSEYEFAPQTVQFCCPHCDKSYYGTGHDGHLVPAAFTCVGCDKPIHMDEMVLHPAQGLEDEQTRVDVVPWLERRKRGRVRAWLATVGMALVGPGRLMRALPDRVKVAPAWWFAMLTNVLFLVASFLPFFILPTLMSFGMPRAPRGGTLVFMLGFAGIGLLAAIVLTAIGLGLWSLITHGVLRLFAQPAATIGRTYEALCYSAGANFVLAVPCFGMYFGWIWGLVSAVIMVAERQRVGGGRATLAVLTFPVLVMVTIVGAYATFFYVVFSQAGAMPFPVTMPATMPTTVPAVSMPVPPLGL